MYWEKEYICMWRERSEEREEFLEPNLSEGREAGPSGSYLQREARWILRVHLCWTMGQWHQFPMHSSHFFCFLHEARLSAVKCPRGSPLSPLEFNGRATTGSINARVCESWGVRRFNLLRGIGFVINSSGVWRPWSALRWQVIDCKFCHLRDSFSLTFIFLADKDIIGMNPFYQWNYACCRPSVNTFFMCFL